MDDFTLDFDPRNAWFNTQPAFAPQVPPPGAAPKGFPFPVKYHQAPPTKVAPGRQVPAMYLAPAPGYGPGAYPVPVPMPMPRRVLRDLTIGDLLPLVALGITALRALPNAPDDARDIDTNLLRQTQFMAALAQHFKADAQLNAVGTIAGKLIG